MGLSFKTTDVDGIKTRYFEAGTGEPLVLIHGGGFGHYYSLYAWSLNFQGLSKSFHVYAFDKLGMGYTDNPKSEKEYTMDATIEHAHDFMTKLGIEGATVAGHSRGAFVAAALALEHPDAARLLVAVDSNTLAPDDPSTPKGFYDKIDATMPRVPTLESASREAVANSYSKAHITKDFADEMYRIARLPKTLEAEEVNARTKTKLFLPRLKTRKERLLRDIEDGRLKQPTLIIWGRNDPSAPLVLALKLFDLMAQKNDNLRLHVFNRSGHYSFREHPEEFDSLVTSFSALNRR